MILLRDSDIGQPFASDKGWTSLQGAWMKTTKHAGVTFAVYAGCRTADGRKLGLWQATAGARANGRAVGSHTVQTGKSRAAAALAALQYLLDHHGTELGI